MLYINEEQVKDLLNWDTTYKAVEVSMKGVSTGRANQEPRTATNASNSTVLLSMPGYLNDARFGALACKLVTYNPNNGSKQIPTVNANILLFDEATGILKAVIAGTEITTWRTAAASVVATRHLLQDRTNDCKILAILGAGVQGAIHAHAFTHFFHFDEVRVWNHNAEKAHKLVDELNTATRTNVFKCVQSNEECVRNADIIITATTAPQPIVQLDWLKKGAHINAVGANPHCHHAELEARVYATSDVFVDHWGGARKELAGLERIGAVLKGEIGNVITGELRSDPDRITVFQSLGMAVEDCAMARMVYDLYVERNQ